LSVRGIDVDVVYKDIKHLHIGVYPPMGRVRVAAPKRLDEDHIRLAIIQRLPWIRRKRDELQNADRQSEREMVAGESHFVWGVRRRLRVIERPGRGHVEVDADRLLLYIPPGTDVAARRKLLEAWQRRQLREAIPPLISRWEPVVGRTAQRWSIRRMKTKWGSCNRETGHIWFNVELAKKDPRALEYIVVHELAHLIERGHGERFTALMDGFMSDWRTRRDDLNAAPLADEDWAPTSKDRRPTAL
jgi:predicted metal-dependent hydrolase